MSVVRYRPDFLETACFLMAEYDLRSVVELGCGSHTTLAIIKERFPEAGPLVGLDKDEKTIASLRRDYPHIVWEVADFLTEWPAVEATGYDFAISSHTLEHMRDPYRFLDLAFHLVRSGGWVLVQVPREWEHREHRQRFDYDRLLQMFCQYAYPQLTFCHAAARGDCTVAGRKP